LGSLRYLCDGVCSGLGVERMTSNELAKLCFQSGKLHVPVTTANTVFHTAAEKKAFIAGMKQYGDMETGLVAEVLHDGDVWVEVV
jgi:hypothetical protein